MSLSWYSLLIPLVFVFIAWLWFDYSKVAVKTEGYPKTKGMTLLFLAFLAFTGILSLSDKLLNQLLQKFGIEMIDPSQITNYKWMMFAAFIILALSINMILRNKTTAKASNGITNTAGQGVANLSADKGNINLTQTFNTVDEFSGPPIVTSHLIDESIRKILKLMN